MNFLSRITWNTNHWEKPSGKARLLEPETYVAQNGFGHEEWLNRREWVFKPTGSRYVDKS